MSEAITTNPSDEQKNLYLLLGGIRVADKIREAIGHQTMSALSQLQEQKLYLVEGYTNFADFLNNSPLSPMSKDKYYRLQEFYKNEAPEEFDLLNSVNIPASQRKLLTAGDVSIEGEIVRVGDQTVQLSDKKGIKKAIARLIEQQNLVENKLTKTEKEVAKKDKQIEELQAESLSTEPQAKASLLGISILQISAGFNDLMTALKELSPEQLASFKKEEIKRIDNVIESFGKFLNEFKPKAKKQLSDDEPTDEELAAMLED